MTDGTSHVHHKFPVSFLLYIATKKTCQINQIITVNSSMKAPISDTSQKNNSCTPCVPMFPRVTYFSSCYPFYQMWPILPNVTHFSSWPILPNVTHYSKCDSFYQMWPIFPNVNYSQSEYRKAAISSTVSHPTFPSCAALIIRVGHCIFLWHGIKCGISNLSFLFSWYTDSPKGSCIYPEIAKTNV